MDFILPPTCLSCRVRVDEVGRLCPTCWGELTFLTGQLCYGCGFLLEQGQFFIPKTETAPTTENSPKSEDPRKSEDTPKSENIKQPPKILCGGCMIRPRHFDHARAALVYDEGSKDLILKFKHGDQTEFAMLFGVFLTQVGAHMIERADIIAPVPLHPKRLRKRGYNQAALIIQNLKVKDKIQLDLLIRKKHTAPLSGNYHERQKNMTRAIMLNSEYKTAVRGKNILILDDVFTTGVTADKCAAALKSAGAKTVEILTVAKVISPQD